MPLSEHYRPAPRFLQLGEGYADAVEAAQFPKQILRFRNDRWAKRIGLAELTDDEWRDTFAGFAPLANNLPEPLALRYHGHQFLNYNADLGDGRGFLFAQVLDDQQRLLDLGTKGSGTTPYSRGADGRLTLKGGVREVLATEMLEALGVYTSKSLSLIETGESLTRHDEPSPARSSVLVRLNHSHIRFGTFQRFAYLRAHDEMRRLVDFSVEHYLPEAAGHPGGPLIGFFDAVVSRSAWLAGELDGGRVRSWRAQHGQHEHHGRELRLRALPLLPTYDSSFIAAYFDHSGLYAFGRQPHAVLWNLAQLADALQQLDPETSFAQPLDDFRHRFAGGFLQLFFQRLGVAPGSEEQDVLLAEAVFTFLENSNVGYEQFFFDWYGGPSRAAHADAGPAASIYASEAFAPVRAALAPYSPLKPVDHPYFSGKAPCTLLIEEVEQIWSAIDERDDWAPFNAKIQAIRQMGQALDITPTPLPPE